MAPPWLARATVRAQVPAPSAAYEAYDSIYEMVEEEELEEPEAGHIQIFWLVVTI